MFRALDQLGRVKIVPSGSNLSNPLAIANGGTGLVQIGDGELYIPVVASIMARLARTTSLNRVLAKYASEASPNWKSAIDVLGPYYIPVTASRPTTAPRAFHFSASGNGSVAFVNALGGNNFISSGTGSLSDGSDAVGTFVRINTGAASGNVFGVSFDVSGVGSNGQVEFGQELLYVCKFRTGSAITSVRLQVGISNSAYPANSDLQADRGIGIRYSTVAGDAGWVIHYGDASTISQIYIASGVSVVASTVYTLTIRVYPTTNGNYAADVDINGTTVTIAQLVPASLFATGPAGYIGAATQTTAARVIDLARMSIVARHIDQQY